MRPAWLLVIAACHPAPSVPPAECTQVGEAFASFQLGNYATPSERAPVIKAFRDACEDSDITDVEVACIGKARDVWTAKQCAPTMFPDAASHDDDRCQRIVANVRASMSTLDPSVREWTKTELDVELHACVEDHWPDGVKACMLGEKTGPDCQTGLPPPILAKLQQRTTEAMKRFYPQLK